MRKSLAGVVSVVTIIVVSSLVAAQTPGGVEPGVWAKVEAQLEAQGLQSARAKADRDVPVEVAKLLPTGGLIGGYAEFGRAIAVDGDLMVVGANDHDQDDDAGAAFVFQRGEGGADAWGQVAKLMASDGAQNDEFGSSVSVSGDTVVVGANQDDDNGADSGSVYIFQRDHGGADEWGQVKKKVAPGYLSAQEDRFGVAVAIYDDTVVVGAYKDDENGIDSGSAYIFSGRQGGADAWGKVVKLLPSDGASYDWFGTSVSISGDTAVVGAPKDFDNGFSTGSLYIFERDQGGADVWGQMAKLTPLGGDNGDYFGYSVAISGDTVVIGALRDDDNGFHSGSAYLFGRNQGGTNAWGQVAKMIASDGAGDDSFGSSISVSGGFIVVGAPGDDDIGLDSGSAYVFDLGHIIFVDGFESGDTSWWSGSQP